MGGGGESDIPLGFTPEEESSVYQDFSQLSSSPPPPALRLRKKVEDGTVDGECGSVIEGFEELSVGIPSNSFELEAKQKKRRVAYQEVLQSYELLLDRSMSLEEGKSKIMSYTHGRWVENTSGVRMSDHNVPNTTALLLIGPKGSGKSSLINKISKVFEGNKFASERAQVSYNSSVGDGTYFLQEYMIPRGSTSFCLFDTRGLSHDSSDNIEMIKNWITEGVHHGELVIRPFDNSHTRTRLKQKVRGNDCHPKETRMVNFVIFVVNGLEVLKSMDNVAGEGTKYIQIIATAFDCPYISFKDDKPVVVITHGDLLSLDDRVRIRVHLGELIGIPPARQIFDIPESHDSVTELTIVDMLHYSLEHADKNLPEGVQLARKVSRVGRECLFACVSLFILAIAILSMYMQDELVHHLPTSKTFLETPKSEAHSNPPEMKACARPPKTKARVNTQKVNAKHKTPVNPANSEANASIPKHKTRVNPSKSNAHADIPKYKAPVPKAHANPSKSKACANHPKPDNHIVDWRSIRHLWLDEN